MSFFLIDQCLKPATWFWFTSGYHLSSYMPWKEKKAGCGQHNFPLLQISHMTAAMSIKGRWILYHREGNSAQVLCILKTQVSGFSWKETLNSQKKSNTRIQSVTTVARYSWNSKNIQREKSEVTELASNSNRKLVKHVWRTILQRNHWWS